MNSRRDDQLLALVLLAGVGLCTALFGAGLLLAVATGTAPGSPALRVLTAGLDVLVATPVAGVAAAMVRFSRRRDVAGLAAGLAVSCILLLSLLIGFR